MKVFVISDDDGNIVSASVPAEDLDGGNISVGAQQGQQVHEVQLPDALADAGDEALARLEREFRMSESAELEPRQ